MLTTERYFGITKVSDPKKHWGYPHVRIQLCNVTALDTIACYIGTARDLDDIQERLEDIHQAGAAGCSPFSKRNRCTIVYHDARYWRGEIVSDSPDAPYQVLLIDIGVTIDDVSYDDVHDVPSYIFKGDPLVEYVCLSYWQKYGRVGELIITNRLRELVRSPKFPRLPVRISNSETPKVIEIDWIADKAGTIRNFVDDLFESNDLFEQLRKRYVIVRYCFISLYPF
jgi:hypothetical protein